MSVSLVTGGAGFIGSHVAKHRVDAGDEVVVIDDLSGGFVDNVPGDAIFREGSVTDPEFITDLFSEFDITYVYHLAAYAAEGLSHFIRGFNYRNNVIGSINLINAAVEYSITRFVFTSSIAVYGSAQVPMTEDTVPRPEDPYGIAKYAVELDLHAASEMFGLDFTIFRPHNVYGEHQNIGDRYRNVVGIFMNQVMKGEAMSVFGDGMQTRAFSHIDDVAPIIAKCVRVPESVGETFNIGADEPYTVLELAEEVARAFDISPEVAHLPARNEVVHAFASHEKVREIFGESEPIGLEEGIARMAAWAKSVGPRRTQPFEDIELWMKFPDVWRSEIAAGP